MPLTTPPLFKKIPATLLTGFLGAGKTTLLNRLLTEEHGQKIAVVVNEFGAVGIDGGLIVEGEETVVELDNGCICCSVRTDLIATLSDLAKRKLGMEGKKLAFDRVVIETTGLADPIPLIQTFFLDEIVATCYELSRIVTVVDAKHFEKQKNYLPLVEKQIAFADIVILNKIDLVEEKERRQSLEIIQRINPWAEVLESSFGEVPWQTLFEGNFLDTHLVNKREEAKESTHSHDHHEGIHSVVLRGEGPLKLDRLQHWIGLMLERCGSDILRYKGFVFSDEWPNQRGVLQGVHLLSTVTPDRPWREDEIRKTELVFIGRNLDTEWFRESFQREVLSL